MVGHVHAVLGLCSSNTRWTLLGARECTLGRGEGSLPHLGELVHQPWVGGLVGLVIHEEDHALVGDDHLGECGPVTQSHGALRGCVDIVHQAGCLDGGHEVAGVHVVVVAHQDSHHVEGVFLNPFSDGCEVVLQGADIQD